jgi:hypothetical protein
VLTDSEVTGDDEVSIEDDGEDDEEGTHTMAPRCYGVTDVEGGGEEQRGGRG